MNYEKGPHDLNFPAPSAPPGYSESPLPPSGFRLALNSAAEPGISDYDINRAGAAPFKDLDGSPIYLGSALFTNDDNGVVKSVHPCKIGRHLQPPCQVPYGGGELGHRGRYDLLLFDENTMEWVETSHGHLPPGRTLVEGGYEESVHEKLYHAAGRVNNILVPGKTGPHLGACHVSFGGGEHTIRENYYILCWKTPAKY
ncbi:hypothetical protein FB45DRAFT_887578 [Roridomyces roridus]|uniref:Uncharacterized protein n=1 Tax=Roridomyces roridus TaxID=1738132 RepID=A0AAD7CLL7_9AGAR|nr:hypothetical protein FB45DRAFT_887578 [Roridomyces roridus]